MRRNITISIEDSDLKRFDEARGETGRGEYIGELLDGIGKVGEYFSEGPKLDLGNEYEIREKVVAKPRGKKELPSQDEGEFKTYFKK